MEETVAVIVDVINKVGFPIACAGAMFWQLVQERKAHREESLKFTQALGQNTAVLKNNNAILAEVLALLRQGK